LQEELQNKQRVGDNMAWYHWIAVYLIIIAGVTFTIIPDKPWWLWIAIFFTGFIGLAMGVLLPHKEEEIIKKEG
jgi:uncharacterized membrane protein YjjB (DUF3815 family)